MPTRKRQSTKPRAKSLPSVAVIQQVLVRIRNGESLTAICKEEGMPPFSSVWARIHQSSALRGQYERAHAARLEKWADEIMSIADTPQRGTIVTDGPKGIETKYMDMIDHRRLQVDTRKWLLSKLLPHRFGDRVEHSGPGGGAIQVEHSLAPAMLSNLNNLRARLPSLPPPPAQQGVVIDATPQPEVKRANETSTG